MSITRTLLIGGLIATGACASLDDLRASAPVRSAVVSANFKDVASCVQQSVLSRYSVVNAVFEREKRAVLTHLNDVSVGFLQAREPVWELTVSEDGAQAKSRVELRSVRNLVGASPWAEDVWPMVETCGRSG